MVGDLVRFGHGLLAAWCIRQLGSPPTFSVRNLSFRRGQCALIPVNDVVETSRRPVQEKLDRVSTVVEHEDNSFQAQMHHLGQLLDGRLSAGVSSAGHSIRNARVLTNSHHPQKGMFCLFGTALPLELRQGRYQWNTRYFPTTFE